MCCPGRTQSHNSVKHASVGGLEPHCPGHLAFQTGKAVRRTGTGHFDPVVPVRFHRPADFAVHPFRCAEDFPVEAVTRTVGGAAVEPPVADEIRFGRAACQKTQYQTERNQTYEFFTHDGSP